MVDTNDKIHKLSVKFLIDLNVQKNVNNMYKIKKKIEDELNNNNNNLLKQIQTDTDDVEITEYMKTKLIKINSNGLSADNTLQFVNNVIENIFSVRPTFSGSVKIPIALTHLKNKINDKLNKYENIHVITDKTVRMNKLLGVKSKLFYVMDDTVTFIYDDPENEGETITVDKSRIGTSDSFKLIKTKSVWTTTPTTYTETEQTTVEQTINTLTSDTYNVYDTNREKADLILGSATSIITQKSIAPCFPRNTPILTDQGIVYIQNIRPGFHTIKRKEIIGISKSISNRQTLVCIEKHAFSYGLPSRTTYITHDHKLRNGVNGRFIKAKHLLNSNRKIYETPYNGEILYNVIMNKHEQMNVNNMKCETLHPRNVIACVYSKYSNYTRSAQNEIITRINRAIRRKDANEYKSILNKCFNYENKQKKKIEWIFYIYIISIGCSILHPFLI